MKRKILVEDGLRNVRDFLQGQGYEVSSLRQHRNNLDNYDAIVVSGQDENFLGISDTSTKSPVIDATSKSAQDVYNQLEATIK